MNNIVTAWQTDNPQWGHALHLSIGWILGIVCLSINHVFPVQWLTFLVVGIVLGSHEILDKDLTGTEPWNGVCDVLAFQPALWGWYSLPMAVIFLGAYIIALWFRGKNINWFQAQGVVK